MKKQKKPMLKKGSLSTEEVLELYQRVLEFYENPRNWMEILGADGESYPILESADMGELACEVLYGENLNDVCEMLNRYQTEGN